MTTYTVERWREVKAELAPLLERHWREVALNHDAVPLDIAHDRYDALDDAGVMHVVTARREATLIGYHIALVTPHLHYNSTLHGITDVYWVAPECRHGVTGLRLFQAVEREFKALGVRKLITATKLHLDQGALFEHMGYTPIERVYTKII